MQAIDARRASLSCETSIILVKLIFEQFECLCNKAHIQDIRKPAHYGSSFEKVCVLQSFTDNLNNLLLVVLDIISLSPK